MFHPGETVVHDFIIPFPVATISKIIVSYKQDDSIILEKVVTSNDSGAFINIDDPAKTKFQILLSQQESLLFTDKHCFTIQLNVYTDGGSRHASCEIKGTSGVQYHREVMSNA